MVSPVEERWKYAQKVETNLQKLLKNKEEYPSYNDIEHLIREFRIACEAVIFLDFKHAVSVKVEQRLWDAHVLINSRYRTMLEGLRKPNKKQHSVEKRNVEKHYVDFIKTSQFFYKGYIQRLASHFSAMDGLRRIAHRLSLETLTADERVRVTPKLKELIETSCHSSLLRLGDLSRYRNQVRVKDRSWEAAMGYYTLANDLCPDKGSAHNQMAVIALADGNHLNAVYHLFRAIAVKEAHPLARGNLGIEFKKVISAWKHNRPHGKTDSLSTLISWFVLLQARFHEGQEFSLREELEQEVLSRLALLLREQSFPDVLEKIVIVSIAAQAFAGQKVSEQSQESSLDLKSYYFCLEFNVRMILVLLQVLSPELEQDLNGEELPKEATEPKATKPHGNITAVARRILPALRQYNTWLAGEAVILAHVFNPDVNLHAKEMWNMYAMVLTKLVNFFPAVGELPTVHYLLEEDEITVGFEPLRNPAVPPECDLFTDMDGVPKVRSTDPGVERYHPNIEMQARIRDILLTAATMESKDEFPLRLKALNGHHVFTYNADTTTLTSPRTMTSPQHPEGPASTFGSARTNGSSSKQKSSNNDYDADQEESTSAADSMNNAQRWVDDLTEPTSHASAYNETSYGMHSGTAQDVFASINPHGYSTRLQSTPKMLPSLTGLYNSAFAPQAHELQATSPNRPTSARQLSPLSLSTKENRLSAAATLEQMTGYSTFKTGSGYWGRNSSRPVSGSFQQPVNEILQESLNQPYMSYSSAFADSSSMYGNTPQTYNRLNGGSLTGNSFPTGNGNSTIYGGASDFDTDLMLRSSLANGGQSGWTQNFQTPPGGQGG
ncbi:uncharacterized protein LY89DRAFT_731115 [Mollisia scopiformis]|uniref:Protein SMG7 n=1 Tax=Mollisia scopiformis TaxID=149040 RepID=A0A194XI16_MOLSC|nr:uncharacterized protein LY89DRAFT_731115 [Mollisia scopiformis]KUJ19865.1 hypothetical protein LY89DRAFT_731115 [Mollisia scopiformis]